MNRKSFIFYRSWYEALGNIKDSDIRLELYEGIAEYALTGELPALSDKAELAFSFLKGMIDNDIDKYETKCSTARATASNRMKKNEVKPVVTKPARRAASVRSCTVGNNIVRSRTKSYEIALDNDNDNVNDNVIFFNPLTPLQWGEETKKIFNYFLSQGFNPLRELIRFTDYNSARGWKIGTSEVADRLALAKAWKGNAVFSPDCTAWVATIFERMLSTKFDAFLCVLEGTTSIVAEAGRLTIFCRNQQAIQTWEQFVEKNEHWKWQSLNYQLTNN